MEPLDLAPATNRLAALVAEVPDDRLDAPTPCRNWTLGALLDHVRSLSVAFTAAARKEGGVAAEPPPEPSGAGLVGDWRAETVAALDELQRSWRDPAAWDGTTMAGGLEMSGAEAGLVVADELVLHGWDVSRALEVAPEVDPELLEAVHGFVAQFSGPGMEEPRAGLFGPEVEVDDDAPLLDQVVAMAGRDPAWAPPG